jgi:hypothetical protein
VGDINTVAVDSLKALDPERPIREADLPTPQLFGRFRVQSGHQPAIVERWSLSGLHMRVPHMQPRLVHQGELDRAGKLRQPRATADSNSEYDFNRARVLGKSVGYLAELAVEVRIRSVCRRLLLAAPARHIAGIF